MIARGALIKKGKGKPRKRVPKPAVVRLGYNSVGAPDARLIFGDYPHEDDMKAVEQRVVGGFATRLASEKRDIKLVRRQEAPDFIYREGNQEFGIELAELVTAAETTNLKITKDVRLRIGKPALYINLQEPTG